MASILSQSKKLATALPLAALALCGCSTERSSKDTLNPKQHLSAPATSRCVGSQHPDALQRTFSAIPQHTPQSVHGRWQNVLEGVGEELNICFKVEHSNNIKTFANKLQSQELDYAYIDPFQLITNKDRYIPLLRDKDSTLRGIIVAKKDSEINSLADLDGKMLLLPSPNSFGSSLLTRDALRGKGITPQIKYVHHCNNVFRGVLKYPETGGGAINILLQTESDEIQSELKTIYQTEAYSPHPIVASAKISTKERQSFQQELIKISKDNDLKKAFDMNPVPANYETDYKAIEQLNLQTLASQT